MFEVFNRNLASTAGCLLVALAALAAGSAAEAKTPGSTYCFVGKCHKVKSLSETASLVGETIPLVASHYSDCSKDRYNPCGLTSSGEPFHPDRADNAASPIYPDGTVLLVRNPATKATVVLRINNAGPYWGNRKLDVSYAAAEKLGFKNRGVAKLETRILAAPNKREAGYIRKRRYRPVPGYIGQFETLEAAERTAVALMVLDATAASATVPSSSAAVVVAARTLSRSENARKTGNRKRLEPILKSMNLIAELKPMEAKAVVSAGRDIQAAPSWRMARPKKPVAVAEVGPAKVVGGSGPVSRAKLVAETGHSPRSRLAKAALADASDDFGLTEMQSTRTAVKLIRTAEVGAPDKDDWEGLLRSRLGNLSIVGGGGGSGGAGGSPFRRLPGRAPVPALPYIPNTARHGMTG
ncbi:MAG: septal ring lytic transglycosylase RlpA family protein [Alphaproteobacteria bacterium]|nr:septal ring lytic transglycosylase RlpA family protein [Alphaproteobacteria bacterium]